MNKEKYLKTIRVIEKRRAILREEQDRAERLYVEENKVNNVGEVYRVTNDKKTYRVKLVAHEVLHGGVINPIFHLITKSGTLTKLRRIPKKKDVLEKIY